jgi:hypothetical protein
MPMAVALPSLRLDGLLTPLRPPSVWSPADQYANDLVREMALMGSRCHRFGMVERAQAPRLVLRVAGVACLLSCLAAMTSSRCCVIWCVESDRVGDAPEFERSEDLRPPLADALPMIVRI